MESYELWATPFTVYPGAEMFFYSAQTERIDQVLFRAALELQLNGWVQGCNVSGTRKCARAAVFHVNADRAEIALGRLRDYVGEPIAQWNDTLGRTKEEVISAFFAAARGEKRTVMD